MSEQRGDPRAIGVFDSGVGGLTVLSALHARLPHESTVYLGDTARVPYGSRSPETVVRYALNNAAALQKAAPLKMLVVACNTASAVSIRPLQDLLDIPVVGVISPGAAAATHAAAHGGDVAVLATRGTVRSEAYVRALRAAGHTGAVHQVACPLFVPLAEEGWTAGDVPTLVARQYLAALPDSCRTVILGCTHYPLLRRTMAAVLSPETRFVDSGDACAAEVVHQLTAAGAHAPAGHTPVRRYLVTDAPEQLASIAGRFLGAPLTADDVQLVDVGTAGPTDGHEGAA